MSADEVPAGTTTAPLEGRAGTPDEGASASPSPSPEPTEKATVEPEPTEEVTPEPTEKATAEPEPTEEVTPEPTEKATAEPEPSPTTGGETGQVAERSLVAKDLEFSEDELRVRAGVTVRLTLVNEDPVEHNFALYESEDAEDAIFVGELFSGPGTERVYEFHAPEEPGEYSFRCDPHAELMTGSLIVR